MPNLLTVESIKASYGRIEVLHDVSFSVRPQTITALIGSNGAGKTTVLKAITGLLRVSSGQVFFKDQNITNRRANEIVHEGISLVPEDRKIFPHMTVLENLKLGAYNGRVWPSWKERIKGIFTIFPRLEERRKQTSRTLSGGEQQMLVIGRGLMSGPELLIIDELSLGLAPLLVKELYGILGKIRSEGITLLLVEQNVVQAVTISNETYVIENGRIALKGSVELLDNEYVRKAYLRV